MRLSRIAGILAHAPRVGLFPRENGSSAHGKEKYIFHPFTNNTTERMKQRGEKYMKATGIVRRIDDLGRVVIPKEIRRTMRIREGDPLHTTLTSFDCFIRGIVDFAGRIKRE